MKIKLILVLISFMALQAHSTPMKRICMSLTSSFYEVDITYPKKNNEQKKDNVTICQLRESKSNFIDAISLINLSESKQKSLALKYFLKKKKTNCSALGGQLNRVNLEDQKIRLCSFKDGSSISTNLLLKSESKKESTLSQIISFLLKN